jgi:hypothetical protein
VFLHTVHTRFSDASAEKRHELLKRFQKLGDDCGGMNAGILFWKVDENMRLGPRRKVDMVQIAIFIDKDAFEKFRAHPVHQALKMELRDCADWTGSDVLLSGREIKRLSAISR